MNFKQFLKPDRRKIGLSIILFILLIDFFIFLENPFVFHGDGFPFPYRYYPQPPIPRNTHQIIMPFLPIFIWGYFILDIFICGLISYFLSCFFFWSKINKKLLISVTTFVILMFYRFIPYPAWSPEFSSLLFSGIPVFVGFLIFLSCGASWIYDKVKKK